MLQIEKDICCITSLDLFDCIKKRISRIIQERI